MKESAKRLLQVGQSRGYETFAAIARALGQTDQTATNWKDRGVSAAAIIEASVFFDVPAGWLAAHPKAKAPDNLDRREAPSPDHRRLAEDPLLAELAENLNAMPPEEASHWRELIKAAAIVARSEAERKAAREKREQDELRLRGNARKSLLPKTLISGPS